MSTKTDKTDVGTETGVKGWAGNTGVRYLGDGSGYIEGVPARDLTRDEWNGVRGDLRALAIATGLYNDPLSDSGAASVGSEEQ